MTSQISNINEDVISKEELYFTWYLNELGEAGYIDQYKYQPKPFLLVPKIHYKCQKKLKTKTKTIERVLFQDHKYQADFMIIWNEKARSIFFEVMESLYLPYTKDQIMFIANQGKKIFSVVDVKGVYNQNDAHRRFSINQKMVFYKYGIYVQAIIPVPAVKRGIPTPKSALFYNSFMPRRYLFTDKNTKKRKINFSYNLLQDIV